MAKVLKFISISGQMRFYNKFCTKNRFDAVPLHLLPSIIAISHRSA